MMPSIFLRLALAVAGLVLSTSAIAKPTLDVDCTDKQEHHLPSQSLKQVQSAITCSITLRGYRGEVEPLTATAYAQWGTKDALKSTDGKSTSGHLNTEGTKVLFDIPELQPTLEFPTCESFTLRIQVVNDEGPVANKKVQIKQDCSKPKPKPLKASIRCSYEMDDGTMYRYPGNGTRMKPRLQTKELGCQILIPSIPNGQAVDGSLVAMGQPQKSQARDLPPASYAIDAGFSVENGDFKPCSDFDVQGELTSDGQTVYKGTLAIRQNCPD